MPTIRRKSSAGPAEPDLSILSEQERATWQMPVNANGVAGPAAMLDEETPEPTATERIALALQTVSEDQRSKVKLYRVKPQTKQLEWCEDYTPAEFEGGGLEMIRDKWGPGDYKVEVYGPAPGARSGFGRVAQSMLTIAQSALRGPASAPGGEGLGQLTRVLESMMQAQQQFQQSVMTALAERPDPSSQMRETLQLMVMMRSAMGLDQSGAKSSIGEIVGAIKELRGAASEIIPERESADSSDPMSMLPSILELVKTGMAQQPQQLQRPPVQVMQALPPVQVPPSMAAAPAQLEPVAAPAPQPTDSIPWEQLRTMFTPREIFKLRALIPELMERAQSNADPADTAALIAEEAPDALQELIEQDGWMDALLFAIPSLKGREAWLQSVRDAYMALPLEEDEQTPAATDAQKQSPSTGD